MLFYFQINNEEACYYTKFEYWLRSNLSKEVWSTNDISENEIFSVSVILQDEWKWKIQNFLFFKLHSQLSWLPIIWKKTPTFSLYLKFEKETKTTTSWQQSSKWFLGLLCVCPTVINPFDCLSNITSTCLEHNFSPLSPIRFIMPLGSI